MYNNNNNIAKVPNVYFNSIVIWARERLLLLAMRCECAFLIIAHFNLAFPASPILEDKKKHNEEKQRLFVVQKRMHFHSTFYIERMNKHRFVAYSELIQNIILNIRIINSDFVAHNSRLIIKQNILNIRAQLKSITMNTLRTNKQRLEICWTPHSI